MFITKIDTPFFKYVSGTVKGSDGLVPKNTVLQIGKVFTQNNKEYGEILGDFNFLGWDSTKDYVVLTSAIQEYIESLPQETTLPEIPYSVTLGDDANYKKETIAGILKPLR